MSDKRVAIRYVAAGVIGVVVLAYVLALVLGALPEKAHIDFAAIVLVVVAAVGVALLFVRTVHFRQSEGRARRHSRPAR